MRLHSAEPVVCGLPRVPALCSVFFLALFVRLGFLACHGVPAELHGDARQYEAYAQSLAQTGELIGEGGTRAARMPGYPAFVAAVYGAAGRSTAAVLVAQCLVGAFSVVLLFLLVERLLGTSWASAAALAGACYYDSIYAAASPLTECLFVAVLTAAFWTLYAANPGVRSAAAGGLLFGAAYLIRPEALAWGGLVLLARSLWRPRAPWRETAAGLSGLLLVVGLWTARNYSVIGRPLPSSTMGGEILYVGLQHPVEDLKLRDWPRYTGPEIKSEVERSAVFTARFKQMAADLSARELLRAYGYTLGAIYYPFLPRYDLSYAWLIPFWVLGMLAALRLPVWWPLAGCAPAFTAIYLLFGGPASRYRFGLAFVLLPMAALGAQTLYERWGRRRFIHRSAAWFAANLLVWCFQVEVRAWALSLKALILG